MALIQWLAIASALFSVGAELGIGNLNLFQTKMSNFNLKSLNISVQFLQRNQVNVVQGAFDMDVYTFIYKRLKRTQPDVDWRIQYSSAQCHQPACNDTEYAAFIYDPSEVKVHSAMLLDEDSGLARNPFTAIVVPLKEDIPAFRIIDVHLDAYNITNELQRIYEIKQGLKENNLVILGDFNAGPPFISYADLDATALFSEGDMVSALGHHVDSVAYSNFTSAIQRILVYGDLASFVVEDSGGIVNTTEEYGITEQEATTMGIFFPSEVLLAETN